VTRPTVAEVLDFEAQNPNPGGHKEERIRRRFGIRAARYYQLLNTYARTPEALAHDPITTNRILDRQTANTETRRKRTLT
jgi:hypothetical protein